MVKKRQLKPASVFDDASLYLFCEKHEIKKTHVSTIWSYIKSHPDVHSFHDIPTLPSVTYDLLSENFTFASSRIVEKKESSDGTIKLLIELQDGHRVESVIMKHKGRTTLCVSSQVGCQMACTFCATGTMGIIGNLCTGEILEQLHFANQFAKIRNVVFMGMGEPLNNYDAVLCAIRAMCDVKRFGLSPNHITLSTVGIIPRIYQLSRDAPYVSLALSLHAPTQELRSTIVPSSTGYPLVKLMEAIDDHLTLCKRMVLIEYVMLKDVNDSPQVAHQLGQLLHNKNVHINLIPYNPTNVGFQYETPEDSTTRGFQKILRDEYQLKATVRENHGKDIDGACGQLALQKMSTNTTSSSLVCGDIEDLLPSKQPMERNSTRKPTSFNVLKLVPPFVIAVMIQRIFGSPI